MSTACSGRSCGGLAARIPEDWLTFGNPWEFARPEFAHDIGFGGSVEAVRVSDTETRQVWHPGEVVQAVAYDTPVVGWRGGHVNTLRLWSARALDPLKLEAFNFGDHVGALADRMRQEAICKVLYPSDETPAGRAGAAAAAGILLRGRRAAGPGAAAPAGLHGDLCSLPERVAIQLNDTHPAIAIAELMRICVDLHGELLPWAEAWEITRGSVSYTNHTLLPEALEKLGGAAAGTPAAAPLQIIYVINAHLLGRGREALPGDVRLLSSVSLIEEGLGRRVRMGTSRRWLPTANGVRRCTPIC